jgi:putative transposase
MICCCRFPSTSKSFEPIGPRTPSCRRPSADREQKQRTCIERHALTGGHRIQKQIIGILREHQAGLSAPELCRKHGISDATFYIWRKKYGGMEVSEARRLKSLEEENAKLKRLLADAMLDVSTLREMLGKNF